MALNFIIMWSYLTKHIIWSVLSILIDLIISILLQYAKEMLSVLFCAIK